jgi:uncharacterized protein
MNIIDRRFNQKGKSLTNRQRFLRRVRGQIQEAVRKASSGRGVTDVTRGEQIGIPTDRLREPVFRKSSKGGTRTYVMPGNREYVRGDKINKPPSGGGQGQGSQGSPDDEGEDDFQFILSKDEFLDLFLDDLELPDLAKKSITKATATTPMRAGYSVSGTPTHMNLGRTMRHSLARRIALHRPSQQKIDELEEQIAELTASGASEFSIRALEAELERLKSRRKIVPFIDPIDVRYNNYEQTPKPVTQAVMFCLMDVSGSMSEHMKDLAKRFFMLLYLFLARRYRHVEIVFVRHTHEAKEVDEKTFFYATESGGTVVSTAIAEMQRIIAERFPPSDWNIYAAQASDGDNVSSDNATAVELLERAILPVSQYYAYIEVAEDAPEYVERESELWGAYRRLKDRVGTLAMRRVRSRTEIFPVFRELFARNRKVA